MLNYRFTEHGHGHGHSHGHGHGHNHDHGKESADVDILVHPAASRRSIVKAAQESRDSREFKENIDDDNYHNSNHSNSSNNENILIKEEVSDTVNEQKITEAEDDHDHRVHRDNKSREKHKNLNMHGVFIHVLGDALGNIGVVCSGLFIYLTHFSWRFYIDPLVR